MGLALVDHGFRLRPRSCMPTPSASHLSHIYWVRLRVRPPVILITSSHTNNRSIFRPVASRRTPNST